MSGTPLTIDELERWTLFGARWELAELKPDHAVVDMCACTGEVVERRRADDPDVIEYLRTAGSDGGERDETGGCATMVAPPEDSAKPSG